MEKLKSIVDFLNVRFGKSSIEYILLEGLKPRIIRYDHETAISLWGCGAIVCISDNLYFISEQDGHWHIDKEFAFSLGWANSFMDALANLQKYVRENGEEVKFYFGKDQNGNEMYGDICHFRLV